MEKTILMKQYLQSFHIFHTDEIETLLKLSKQKTINKMDYFIREGDVCKEVAFVLSGTLRSFYISTKIEEITYCITFPNNLLTAYSSFITGQPTEENIQAITTVELLVISKSEIDKLAQHSTNWVKFSKIIAEQQYIELEKRIFQLQKNNALKRYTDLLNNQPEYIQQIPLQYLASYLGITQRHLSRIRKEIST